MSSSQIILDGEALTRSEAEYKLKPTGPNRLLTNNTRIGCYRVISKADILFIIRLRFVPELKTPFHQIAAALNHRLHTTCEDQIVKPVEEHPIYMPFSAELCAAIYRKAESDRDKPRGTPKFTDATDWTPRPTPGEKDKSLGRVQSAMAYWVALLKGWADKEGYGTYIYPIQLGLIVRMMDWDGVSYDLDDKIDVERFVHLTNIDLESLDAIRKAKKAARFQK